MYNTAFQLLNQFYPERTITVTSRDPGYITPAIKASLRRKNRLMRAGRVGVRFWALLISDDTHKSLPPVLLTSSTSGSSS